MSQARVPPYSPDAPRAAARGLTPPEPAAGDVRPGAGGGRVPRPARRRGPVVLAAAVGWLIYVAIFAGVFVLSGYPAALAIRGSFANAIPDGLLALGVVVAARRLPWAETEPGRFPLAHAVLAPALAALATLLKVSFLWADTVLMRPGEEFRLGAGILAWQLFISLLVYVAVAGVAYAGENARRLREAAEAAERAETLRVRAELAALRARLNPHFLFNVLHSALGLVRRDPALAERALERLGDLLRHALRVHRDDVDWTPLREEWEFAESYLDLERIRLGDRLRIAMQADPAALAIPVPSFCLQPLVENAVRHGIAPRAVGGLIRIRASLAGDTLRLEVENEGVGEAAGTREAEPGMGLRVLRDRLEALYGGRASLAAAPAPQGSFRVVLDLPRGVAGGEAEG